MRQIFPGPFYRIGQRVETRSVNDETDDQTKRLVISRGVISAQSYTNHVREGNWPGWSYYILKDDGRETQAHETEITALEE